MPIDALTLGIGLQGKHDFSLDGLKYQLDTQREEAKAAADKQKKDYDSWSDPIKQSMALDTSGLPAYLQPDAENVTASLVTDLMKMRESGNSFGANEYKLFMDTRNRLSSIKQEGDQWKGVKNVPQEVQKAVNSREGLNWFAERGPEFGAMISPNQRDGVSVAYPKEGMGDFNSVLTDAVKSIPEGELISPTGNVKTYAQDGKTIKYREHVMDPQRKAAKVDEIYTQLNADPMLMLSFVQQNIGTDKGLSLDYFTQDPNSDGIIPKPEFASKIRNTISTAFDKRVRMEEEEYKKEEPTTSFGSGGSGETKDYSFEFVESDPVRTGEGPVFEDIGLVGGLRTQYKGKTPKTFNMQLPNGSYELGNKGVQKLDNKSTGRTITASAVQSDIDKDGKFWYTVQSISQEAPQEKVDRWKSELKSGNEEAAQEIMDNLIRDKYVNTYIIPENPKVKSDFFSGIGIQGEEARNKLQKQMKDKYLGESKSAGAPKNPFE